MSKDSLMCDEIMFVTHDKLEKADVPNEILRHLKVGKKTGWANQKKNEKFITDILIVCLILIGLGNFCEQKNTSTQCFAKVYMVLIH
jgi:hypothetical protein